MVQKFHKLKHNRRCSILFSVYVSFMVILIIYKSTEVPEVEHKEWPRSRSRNVSDYINYQTETALIRPEAFERPCKNGLLWIFVVSAPQNFRQREIARSSWLNQTIFVYDAFKTMHAGLEGTYLDALDTNREVQFTFLLGRTKDPAVQRKIAEEGLMHGDILQEDIEDSYGNLVLKSILALKWASHQKCIQKYKYITKVDDDNFINVPNLIHLLAGGSLPTDENFNIRLKNVLILGGFNSKSIPSRWIHSKYYCPTYMYEGNLFPPYALGFGYVISQNITEILFDASFSTPLLHIEDVYITGILREKCGFTSTHSDLFATLPTKGTCSERTAMAENLQEKAELLPSIVDKVLDPNIKC